MRIHTPRLKTLIFMALCCVLSLFSKRIISPATSFITDLLRIPGGGVSAGIGFCFLLIGASVSGWRWAATAMSLTQGLLALSLGIAGNQGLLAPVTYSIPGFTIDLVRLFFQKKPFSLAAYLTAGGISASLNAACSNLLVFHFRGFVLFLWIVTAMFAGLIGGVMAWFIRKRLPDNGEHYDKSE